MPTFTPAETVRAYFDAWNAHDADAVLATLASDGKYSDPVGGPNLSGPAYAAYLNSLFTAFPDLSLELINIASASNGMLAAPWLLFGTHKGPLGHNAPTHKTIVLPGCDFITTQGDKVKEVRGYFDPSCLFTQLGLS